MNLILNEWTDGDYLEFVGFLKTQADEKYRSFHSSLVPNAEKSDILGIRMPRLREIGKENFKGQRKELFRCFKVRALRGAYGSGNCYGTYKDKRF